MYYQSFYILLRVFIFTTGFALPFQLNNHFRILENFKILTSAFRQYDNVGTVLDCAIYCPVTSGCSAVKYSPNENMCYFYDWNNISVEKTLEKQQNLTAVNTAILLFHVTGSTVLTFTGAETLCKHLGGQLATVSDLYDARDLGYDLCRCGWVADESIRFVIQYERPGCNSYGSGVISCKDMTSSTDVYCKLM